MGERSLISSAVSSRQFIACRTLLEQVSRGRTFHRRLPREFGGGRIVVSPQAMLKFWLPCLELVDASLFDWVRRFVKEGDVVWDIGANVGIFAFSSLNQVGASGSVLAVEADTWLVDLLRRSARELRDPALAINILPAAVSDQLGVARFNIAARSRASNYLDQACGSTQAGGIGERQTVVTVTLDWLLDSFRPPTVLKIDVEGAEDQVLAGASYVLAQVRPTILCEVTGGNAAPVYRRLQSYGYTLYDLSRNEQHVEPGDAAFNILAVPAGEDRDRPGNSPQ